VADYVVEVDAAAKATTSMADSALSDVFAKVQLDLDQISGGVGKTVSEFVTGLDTMTKATHVNAQAIEGYLTKAFDSAKNQAEIQAVIDKMAVLHAQGKLVGQPYLDSLAQASASAKKLATESVAGATAYIAALKAQKAVVDEAYKKGQIGAEQHKQEVGRLNQELGKTTQAAKKNVDAADDMTRAYSDFGMQSAKALEEYAENEPGDVGFWAKSPFTDATVNLREV
jgi:polyhydroxyalkanoate synthesis regulator phasin